MQNYLRKVLATTALAAGLAAGAGQAAIISVDDDLAGSRYLSSGRALSGTFDLRPFLQADSVIDWARVTFQFEDDDDPLRYIGSSGSYSYGYNRYYVDDVETVSVMTAGQSSFANTTSSVQRRSSSRVVPYTASRTEPYRVSYRCGIFNLRTCYRTRYRTVYYTAYRTVVDTETRTIASGPFSASYLLDRDALNRLLDVGMASFQVTGVRGDAMFRNATLVASVSSVPEPSAFVLVAMGLGGLMLRRRSSQGGRLI